MGIRRSHQPLGQGLNGRPYRRRRLNRDREGAQLWGNQVSEHREECLKTRQPALLQRIWAEVHDLVSRNTHVVEGLDE